MMRLSAAVAATGLVSLILLEIVRILMEPITVWVMGLLATALKIALTAALVLGGLAIATGIGVYFYRRHQRKAAEA